MKKLWEKGKVKLDPIIEAFETGDDLLLDQKLVKYDVLGSLAQAKMLLSIGILSEKEHEQLKEGLLKIYDLNQNQQFVLKEGDEDVHTKIENFLTENYGEAGKKIHTGRSRNDQVLTAIRLFIKEELLQIWEKLLQVSLEFLNFAKKYEFVPMPGYTHMQKAMPSSLGLWAGSFLESFLDSLKTLKTAYEINDQSPLGSAAAYGVPLNLKRELTASLLGFSKVQNNALYCQNSKGRTEAVVLGSLISILLDLNKFSSDILLFTTSEFNYFAISDRLSSGSSIMPQKKNFDAAELLRGKVHLSLANYVQLVSLSSNLISGYNRDLQEIKKPLFESLETVKKSLDVAKIIINNIIPNKDVLKKALTSEIFAAHNAFSLVKKGVSFRTAYAKTKYKKQYNTAEILKILKSSTHAGGTGNLGLQKLFKIIKSEEKILLEEKEKFELTVMKLIKNEMLK